MSTRFPEITATGPFSLLKGQAALALSRFSLPLAEGALRPGAGLSLEGPDGVRAPLQTRPLVLWRDGSVRWLDAETLVSTPGTCRIREGAAAPAPGPPRSHPARGSRPSRARTPESERS